MMPLSLLSIKAKITVLAKSVLEIAQMQSVLITYFKVEIERQPKETTMIQLCVSLLTRNIFIQDQKADAPLWERCEEPPCRLPKW
jgi:hypothetical protein